MPSRFPAHASSLHPTLVHPDGYISRFIRSFGDVFLVPLPLWRSTRLLATDEHGTYHISFEHFSFSLVKSTHSPRRSLTLALSTQLSYTASSSRVSSLCLAQSNGLPPSSKPATPAMKMTGTASTTMMDKVRVLLALDPEGQKEYFNFAARMKYRGIPPPPPSY